MEKKNLKNEKTTKYIMLILAGVLLLVICIPTNRLTPGTASSDSLSENASCETELLNQEKAAAYYEEKLQQMLEESYGAGTVSVMVHLKKAEKSELYFDTELSTYTVEGVLVVARVSGDQALLEITQAVCSLFDLPAHKVAVLLKK